MRRTGQTITGTKESSEGTSCWRTERPDRYSTPSSARSILSFLDSTKRRKNARQILNVDLCTKAYGYIRQNAFQGTQGHIRAGWNASDPWRTSPPKQRAQYEAEWKMYNDYYNTLDFAVEKGMKKGMEKGLQEGLQKGKAERKSRRTTGRETLHST